MECLLSYVQAFIRNITTQNKKVQLNAALRSKEIEP